MAKDQNFLQRIFSGYWVFLMIVTLFMAFQCMSTKKPAETYQQEFMNKMLPGGDVARINIIRDKNIVNVTIKADSVENYSMLRSRGFKNGSKGPHYTFTVTDIGEFAERFHKAQETIPGAEQIKESSTDGSGLSNILWTIGPLVLIIAFWIFMMRRMAGGGSGGSGGVFNVGKSQAKLFDAGTSQKITFKDVAGLAEAKQEVEEVVSFLKQPAKYTRLGGKIPKGVLLVGPPGTGKTLMARAMAGEANVPFFSLSGSDFVEMFVGVGASRVRDLFKQAKAKAPCIVFIDEIDAIGRARGKNLNMGGNDERENTLNQLLTEMDGFETNSGVIIVAATNRVDILDSALLRAGRFDRQINVDLPELNDRKEIFAVHLKNLRKSNDVDIDFLAKQTPGFSGADIANVANEAALIAARKDHDSVDKQDFLDAIDRIIGGLENRSKIIQQSEKRAIAIHEAGHATCSWLLQHAHPLLKVTIVPRGKALGAAWYLPKERQITTREQLMDQMCSLLGGRAAEELTFGQISTGAQNDLERSTKQAYAMVSIFGMSEKVGNVSYYDSTGQSGYGFTKPYSEKTAELIDKEAKELIDSAYNRAKELLSTHKEQHEQLAQLLLEREVIFSDDLENILGKRPWADEDENSEKVKLEGEETKENEEVKSE